VGLELRWTLRAGGNYNPLAATASSFHQSRQTLCASGALAGAQRLCEQVVSGD
jgi:hypothetical protein